MDSGKLRKIYKNFPITECTGENSGVIITVHRGFSTVTDSGSDQSLTYDGVPLVQYTYDAETDLYYMESRYYDSAIERFINGDILFYTGQGFVGNNTFSYCLNNPIQLADPTGTI